MRNILIFLWYKDIIRRLVYFYTMNSFCIEPFLSTADVFHLLLFETVFITFLYNNVILEPETVLAFENQKFLSVVNYFPCFIHIVYFNKTIK